MFLILRRVGIESPEGKTLATYLAAALHDLCGKPIHAPLKCHSAGIYEIRTMAANCDSANPVICLGPLNSHPRKETQREAAGL